MISLLVHCAGCQTRISLTLTEIPKSLMLNCPACKAGLVLSQGRAHALERGQVERWKDSGRPRNFGDLLNLLNRGASRRQVKKWVPYVPKKIRKGPITGDEVANLIIDLNTTASVDEFLNKI